MLSGSVGRVARRAGRGALPGGLGGLPGGGAGVADGARLAERRGYPWAVKSLPRAPVCFVRDYPCKTNRAA